MSRPAASPPAPSASAPYERRWLALLILSLSLLLVLIDATIVNVAIPSIVRDFNASFSSAEWVNTIYSLIFAATLILWGKIGDQYGRRRLFLIGAALFGVGSALVGLSQSVEMLVAMRALQGLGAAMLSPSTLSILTTTFRGRERGIAFGVWGATAGVGAALGPLLGGWVIDHGSWSWAFFINVPIVILALAGALWAVPESRDPLSGRRFDVLGTLLGGFGLAALVFGIIEGQTYGWWKPERSLTVLGWTWPLESVSIVPIAIAVGVVLLILFTWYERRLERADREPLFEFGLLRFRSYRYGMITGLIVNLGEIGLLFAVSLYLQGTRGLSAFDTGLHLLPLAIFAGVGAPVAGAFAVRLGPKWIVTTGMVIEVFALLGLAAILSPTVSTTIVAAVLGIYGLGLGLAIAQLASLVLYDIPARKAGVAAGGNSTIRQVGAALGIAVIGTVLTSSMTGALKDDLRRSEVLAPQVQALEPMVVELAKQPVAYDFAAILTQGAPVGHAGPAPAGGSAPADGSAPAPASPPASAAPDTQAGGPPAGMPDMAAQGEEVGRLVESARTHGMQSAALAAAIFVAVGALSSLRLPNPRGEAMDGVEGA